ncbi:MAG: HEPN domain-containing protein [Thermaerobacter sp.]|nr:HEPN domain-containing protein [Thermaerobacter sp.]
MGRGTPQEWWRVAEEDLTFAGEAAALGHPVWSLVLCQQALEKTLKGLYLARRGRTPPHTHDLLILASRTDVLHLLDANRRRLLVSLTNYYRWRYPDTHEHLARRSTAQLVSRTLEEAGEVMRWLRQRER